MWNTLANVILRNRFIILGAMALLTVWFGYYIPKLKIDNKYGNMLPKDTETQQNYIRFKQQFGEDGSALVIAVKDDSLYTPEKFLAWKKLGDSILKLDGVNSVLSEAKLLRLEKDTVLKQFVPKPIFSDVTYKEKKLDEIKREIRSIPLYDQMFYNDSAHVSIMLVGIDEQFLLDKKKQKVVIDIENLADSYKGQFEQIHFAGLPHMRVLIGKRILNEMYIFVAISIAVSSLLMYFLFRSIRVTLICNLVVIVTVIWAMGSIAMFGYSVSIMMALIPPLMIVIGIPNCIYLYNKYHQEFKAHNNKAKALHRTIKKTGVAMWLTNVTTAIGFMTFLFTNSDKFFEFGVISSVNIMFCYVVSIALIPIFASLSKNPPERHLRHLDRKMAVGLLERLVRITSNHRPLVYIITIVVTIGAGAGIVFMKVTGNITGDLPKNDPILKDVKFMEKNFGGAIPFEILINYKEGGRLYSKHTLNRVEEVQTMFAQDTLFAKSISIVDFIKVVNMAYNNNDPNAYILKLSDPTAKLEVKKYVDNFAKSNTNSQFSIREVVDTTSKTLRIRTQMKDLGSYEVADRVKAIRNNIDSIMNPDKKDIERLYAKAAKGKKAYIDSIIDNYSYVNNSLAAIIAKGNPALEEKFNYDPSLIKNYYGKSNFMKHLRSAIDSEYYDVTLTGVSVVASEGTRYLVDNLVSSIIFAIISIAALMAVLFYSFRMVVVSMIPNIIPMIVTAGIMGWFGIPLKPSTLLIFSIALGITVDNTIHFLAHYRHELKLKKWDLKDCIAISIRETGLSIIYTSVILFFGFIVFVFSDFGGTQALGYLSAITYFVALFTNMILLPCLLLSYERKLTTKSFEEPLFEIFDEEEDFDLSLLEVSTKEILNNKLDE